MSEVPLYAVAGSPHKFSSLGSTVQVLSRVSGLGSRVQELTFLLYISGLVATYPVARNPHKFTCHGSRVTGHGSQVSGLGSCNGH